jgi:hypothetical protein
MMSLGDQGGLRYYNTKESLLLFSKSAPDVYLVALDANHGTQITTDNVRLYENYIRDVLPSLIVLNTSQQRAERSAWRVHLT